MRRSTISVSLAWRRLPERRLGRCLAALLIALIAAPQTPHAAAFEPSGVQSTDLPDLSAIEQAFERVVEKVSPQVVGIRAQRRRMGGWGAAGGAEGELFGQHVVVNGSGTIVSSAGLILTNEHVVQSASEIEVMFHDGQKLCATVLAADSRSDLAILQVDRVDLPVVRFCDWERVARGQWTIALGNPFGLGRDGTLSVSVGVVSNLGRQLPGLGEVDDRFYNNMIQTTAPINPGNSGGPLFSINGELIGIVTAMHTRAPADEGVGFAIPLTAAKRRVIEELCRGRLIQYGYLGLTVRAPNDEELAGLSGDANPGAVVQRIEPDGPADEADVRLDDRIVRYDGQPVRGPAHLAELVGSTPVGTHVQLQTIRDDRALVIPLTVDLRDVSRVSWMRGGAVIWRGMRLADLTADARRLMQLHEQTHGVVVIDVVANSPAKQAGVEIGDVIMFMDGEPIHDTRDFLATVRGADGPVVVSVHERGTAVVRP